VPTRPFSILNQGLEMKPEGISACFFVVGILAGASY
jgi:hypothetical protein